MMKRAVSIDLAWWPPDPDEPMGADRAAELITALRPIIRPVVDAAEADLREHAGPHAEIVRSAAPAGYIARVRFGLELWALCLGTVYEVHNGDAKQNAIELLRDGAVTSWRGR